MLVKNPTLGGRQMRQQIVIWCLGWLALWLPAWAAWAEVDFLEPEEAFQLSVANHSPTEIDIHFQIAPEYYMYQERFAFALSSDQAQLGNPEFPPAIVVYDPTFDQDMEVYKQQVTLRLPVEPAPDTALPLPVELDITSQGCADAGLCYTPITQTVTLQPVAEGFEVQGQWAVDEVPAPLTEPAQVDAAASQDAEATDNGTSSGAATEPAAATASGATATSGSTQSKGSGTGGVWQALQLGDTGLAQFLGEAGLWEMVLLAYLLGLLLSFTPCVLPMVPILLSIIAGQSPTEAPRRSRDLGLAAVYVLGVSVVYTALGIAAGLVGASLAIWLQTPWVLVPFALILALLALSLFDVYNLQVPASAQARLQGRLAKLPAGRYGGVFLMGMLSALIVGPCMAAPLAGVLLFISQTGSLWLGGLTLFALAWGSGTLLLVVGAGAGRLMPKAGPWMNTIKYGFGLLLLATAWWMLSLSALLPGWLWVLGWVVLALWAAFIVGLTRPAQADSGPFHYLAKAIGFALAAWALLLLVGLGMGNDSVLRPLAVLGSSTHTSAAAEVRFQRIQTEAELDRALAQATQPVMLDFYADWCVSCIEMERFTFTDPTVAAQMQGFLLLQVDVTDITAEHRALLKRFDLFGPPGIIFFDAQGKQLADPRVVGYQAPERFSAELAKVLPY